MFVFFLFFLGGGWGGVWGVNKNNYFLGLEIFVDILGGSLLNLLILNLNFTLIHTTTTI